MKPSSPPVTVGALLRARAESLSLGLELLAGAGGLERGITSPYVLKTGLALAGFDSYLQEGRVLVFGASEVGYLDGQAAAARAASLARVMARHIPCVLVTDGLRAAARGHGRGRARGRAAAADAGGDADRHRQAHQLPRGHPGRADHPARRAHGRSWASAC